MRSTQLIINQIQKTNSQEIIVTKDKKNVDMETNSIVCCVIVEKALAMVVTTSH